MLSMTGRTILAFSFICSLVGWAETVTERRHGGLSWLGWCVVRLGRRRSKILRRVGVWMLHRWCGCRIGVLHRRRLVHGVHVDALGGHRVLV